MLNMALLSITLTVAHVNGEDAFNSASLHVLAVDSFYPLRMKDCLSPLPQAGEVWGRTSFPSTTFFHKSALLQVEVIET